MRSNIAWTCGSGSVPGAGILGLTALEGPEVVHELLELLRVLLPERRERGHRSRRVDQRPSDGGPRQARADLGEVGAGSRVPVLADPVAAEAARRRHDVLAALVVGGRLEVDLRRRPGERALEREV